MKKFSVTGMSCAACSARVEKAVNKVKGVTSCSVSLLTNSMGVEGSADDEEIIKAVVDAGYGASLSDDDETGGGIGNSCGVRGNSRPFKNKSADFLENKELPGMLKRLFWSLGFVLVLMYFSMGHMMWKWPLPAWFDGNHIAMGLIQMILAAIVMVINQKFFISGFKGLAHRSPNMDTLVALGSGVSFIWSVFVLFEMTDAQLHGNSKLVEELMMKFYFESAAMILALITVGKTLESYSKGKTTNALKSLLKLAPETACVIRDDKEITVGVEMVLPGDFFVVRPGESIPVDGEVTEGTSAVNESALTGESVPVDKISGSKVFAGTINQSGFLKCRALKVGKDTTLSQIIKMVSDAAATKAPVAKIADKVSGVFVPAVISIAVVVTIIWLIITKDVGYSLARGISVLVISCPCALGLATPVAIMVGNGVGARNGILFKTSESLENTGKANIVVLDKTGTITEGKPVVTDIFVLDGNSGNSKDDFLKYAVSLESKSEHPLAKAVTEFCKNYEILESSDFEALPGNGLKAVINGKSVFAGNEKFINSQIEVSGEIHQKIQKFAGEGKTPLIFGISELSGAEKKLLGIIAVADTIKKDSRRAVEELKAQKISVYMLTGDNRQTALAIANQAGIENVISDVLPAEKENAIRELQKKGKVIMVGDGINDAPSLTRADIGIAIGSGTDVAIDAADVVLMNSSLEDVAAAIKLSRKTILNIYENLFWAFIYNIIGIPLAAGAFIKLFGWELNPMFGAAAMSLSSFCVVSNALRLNLVKIKKSEKEKQKAAGMAEKISGKAGNKKESDMTKTLKIEGMMCEHCEAHVKKALEKIDGVTEAVANHKNGTAVVKLSKEVDEDLFKKAITDADYKYLGIE